MNEYVCLRACVCACEGVYTCIMIEHSYIHTHSSSSQLLPGDTNHLDVDYRHLC